jgi:tetratricopeptide (TPR) repeat protein
MGKRTKIPAEIERQIMLEAGHRCAVCGTPMPLERAHIIPWHRIKEHKARDLICLCANCHTRADSEKWGTKMLREYKRRPWVLRQFSVPEQIAEPMARLTFTVDPAPSEFDEQSQQWLKYAVAGFLRIQPESVQVVPVEDGNVRATVELPCSDAERLLSSYATGDPELAKYLAPLVLIGLEAAEDTTGFVATDAAGESGCPERTDSIIHNLPYPSIGQTFKGRSRATREISEQLCMTRTTAITQPRAIHGLGGVGKTRLAVEYAWDALRRKRYRVAFFVRAQTAAMLEGDIAELAAPNLLNLAEHGLPRQADVISAVTRRLSKSNDWLLIIDGVDSPSMVTFIREYLAKLCTGHIIVTSRLSNWPPGIVEVAVDVLEPTDSVAYLLERTRGKRVASSEDEALALDLSGKLDGLPIALEQAASYIAHRRVGFRDYLDEFARARQEVLSWYREGEVDYPVPVLAAWEATERQLGYGERAVLRISSFFASAPIPAKLFEAQPAVIGEAMQCIVEESGPIQIPTALSREKIRAMLGELTAFSMLKLEADHVTVHRLVQDSVRLRIASEHYRLWLLLVLRSVDAEIPDEPRPHDFRSWSMWRVMAPHVDSIAQHADAAGIPFLVGSLKNALGTYFLARARFSEAEPLLRRALELDESSFGPEHVFIGRDLNDLGQLCHALNRLDEAEPMMCRALAIAEKEHGQRSVGVSLCLNNLAGLLAQRGEFAEAERMYRQALSIAEEVCGQEHPDVAIRLHNLAGLLCLTDRFSEAEPMMRRALAIDEAALGPQHPNVAYRLFSLGSLLVRTGHLEEAEPLLRGALEVDLSSLGVQHPNVARDRRELARLLRQTNRLQEADLLFHQALESDEASFSSDHPQVVTGLQDAAASLRAAGRPREAEPLCRKLVGLLDQSDQPNGPELASALNELAVTLKTLNRLDEAEPLYRRALTIAEQSLGSQSTDVATYAHNLAVLLQEANRLQEAEELERRALGIDGAKWGPDHPHVARDLSGLAEVLRHQGRLSEAEDACRRAVDIAARSLGPGNDTLAVYLSNLSVIVQASGRLREAVDLASQAVSIGEAALGPNHPKLATRLNNLAVSLKDSGRLEEAEPVMRRVIAMMEASLGPRHPSVAVALNNLASLLCRSSRLAEAESLMARAVKIDESALVPTHPTYAVHLENTAGLLERMGRTREAAELYHKALAIYEVNLGRDHAECQAVRASLRRLRSS